MSTQSTVAPQLESDHGRVSRGDTAGVIARAERYLERKFGTPYVDYKRRVRRWL